MNNEITKKSKSNKNDSKWKWENNADNNKCRKLTIFDCWQQIQTQILRIANRQNDVIEKREIVNVNKQTNVDDDDLISILLKTFVVVIKVKRN